MFAARQRKAMQLARWLGPWSSADKAPHAVHRRRETLAAERPVRAYVYEPEDGPITGCYLVVPGLHFSGPDDPRVDRFCRILASAGLVVVAMFVEAFGSLRFQASCIEDVAVATEHAAKLCGDRGLPRPALFSISFGSCPAIQVAASEQHRDQIGALVIFGGFHDFRTTVRFAVSKRAFDGTTAVELPHDPLNSPAVFINIVDHLGLRGDVDALERAWLTMAQRTWGRDDLRLPARRFPIAEAIAFELPSHLRELFLIGCGLAPGAPALLEQAFTRLGDAFDFADPRPHLPRIAAPVVINHGRDDDVVPYTEAAKLRSGLRNNHPHQVHLTGIYGHSGSNLPTAGAVAREVDTLQAMIMALVDAPHEAIS